VNNKETKPKTCPVVMEETKTSRRTFIEQITTVAIGFSAFVTAGFGTATMVRFLTPPEVDLEGRSKMGWLEIGTTKDFDETPQKVDYGDEPIFVYYLNKKLVAFSAVCPHVRCIIEFDAEGKPDPKTKTHIFECPCHAAAYDLAGRKLFGPQQRGLYKQKMRISGNKVSIGGGTPAA
jgi:Rieske Fe-S protein